MFSRFAMRLPVTPLPISATRRTINGPAVQGAAIRHAAGVCHPCRGPGGMQQTFQPTGLPKSHHVAASFTEHVRRTTRMQPRTPCAGVVVVQNRNETHRFLGGLVTGVGLPGIEPGTSSLSAMRSNRLSYSPSRYETLSADSQINTRCDATNAITHKTLVSVRYDRNRRRCLPE